MQNFLNNDENFSLETAKKLKRKKNILTIIVVFLFVVFVICLNINGALALVSCTFLSIIAFAETKAEKEYNLYVTPIDQYYKELEDSTKVLKNKNKINKLTKLNEQYTQELKLLKNIK